MNKRKCDPLHQEEYMEFLNNRIIKFFDEKFLLNHQIKELQKKNKQLKQLIQEDQNTLKRVKTALEFEKLL